MDYTQTFTPVINNTIVHLWRIRTELSPFLAASIRKNMELHQKSASSINTLFSLGTNKYTGDAL